MVCLPIWFGVHKKTHDLANVKLFCYKCYAPRFLHYFAHKRAFHFMFIPLFPAGTKVYSTCSVCQSAWEIEDAPSDASLPLFAFLSLLMLGFGLYMGLYIGYFEYLLLSIGFMAIFSIIYLFMAPRSLSGFSQHEKIDPAKAPEAYGQATPTETAIPLTTPDHTLHIQRAIYTGPSSQSYTGGGTYSIEALCPYCRYPVTKPRPNEVLTCHKCMKKFRA